VSKLHFVEEECDESIYWLEIIEDLLENENTTIKRLQKDMNEILSIVVTALKTAKGINADKP
jgi:four helix bundle protein